MGKRTLNSQKRLEQCNVQPGIQDAGVDMYVHMYTCGAGVGLDV